MNQLLTSIKKHEYWILVLVIIFIVYLPFVLHGGFIIDDWAVAVSATKQPSAWELYKGWFLGFSNRPLAPIILVVASKMFGMNTVGYALFNVVLWMASVIITAKVLQRHTSRIFVTYFTLFAAFPVVATTIIFSIGMQLVGTVAFLLWSLSFSAQDRYLQSGRSRYAIISYLMLLAGFFTYEIILPMLVLSVLYPIYDKYAATGRLDRKSIIRSSAIFLSIVVIVMGYQKLVIPHFFEDISRLHPSLSPIANLKIFIAWLIIFCIGYPATAVSSIFFDGFRVLRSFWSWATVAIIVAQLTVSWRARPSFSGWWKLKDWALLLIFLVSFLAGAALYLLNGTGAVIGGYGNRGSSSAWFCLAMVLAFIMHKARHFAWYVVMGLLLILTVTTFTVERDQYIKSYATQLAIADDVAAKVAAQRSAADKSVMILGNVPHYLYPNFNNEDVFDSWGNFGLLILRSNGAIAGGHVLANEIMTIENGVLTTDRYRWSSKLEDLWFYEYDQKNGDSRLVKVVDEAHLRRLMEATEKLQTENQSPKFIHNSRFFEMMWTFVRGSLD